MSDDYKLPRQGIGLDSRVGVVLLRVVLFASLAIFVLGGYAVVQFHGLRTSDSMEMSHIAHNLATGGGYTTLSITPFDIWYLEKHGIEVESAAIPNIRHAPGYPLLLSLMYRIARPSYQASRNSGLFDAEYKAVIPLGILLTLMCAATLFVFGRHIFNSRVAMVATVIYLVSNLTLSSMVSGTPLPLLSFAVTLVFAFSIRAVQLSGSGESIIKLLLAVCGCAVFATVAILSDYTMIAVIACVLLLFAIQLQRLRWVSILLFIVMTGLLISPWLLHNHKLGIGVLGAKQYDAVAGSALYQGNSLARTVEPEFNSYRTARAIRHKVISAVAENFSGTKAVAGGVIICFFVLALFHRYEKREVTAFKWMILGMVVILALLMPLIGCTYSVFVAIFPITILLGASAFIDYLDREEYFEQGMQQLLMWALIVISALPAVAQVIKGADYSYPPYYAPIQQFVCSMIEDDEILYTDIPWATAWYGNTVSMLIPEEIADIEKITNGWSKVGGVYLTSETANRPVNAEASWRSLWHQKVPENIPLHHSIEIPAGRADQLFLSDEVRW